MLVIALVGRRIDAPDAPFERFPLSAVPAVRERLRRLFHDLGASAIVCSAACGADLIALAEAGAAGLHRRIVLPFDEARFRGTSVTDRPGDWGPVYDSVIREVAASGDLVVLDDGVAPDEDEAYARVNGRILHEALRLTPAARDPVAVLVWEGESRGDGDLTAAFGTTAAERGLEVIHLRTNQA